MRKQTTTVNQVRINAGIWRSRLLKFPDVDGLRPTPERVRQTVFNWLGQDLSGQTCLDLFAGTGAFGFEALSRRASSATLVEYAASAYQALLHNQQALDATNCQIVRQDALAFLENCTHQYDIIFCDPPYHHEWLNRLMPLLPQYLKPDGLVYIEAEYAIVTNAQWQVHKHGKAGNVFYHLIEYR